MSSWLSVVRLMTWLPWSIDQQLQRDSNLGMVEYQVLAMLARSEDRTLRMSSLAEVRGAASSAGSPIRPTGASPTPSSPTRGSASLPRLRPDTSRTSDRS